MSPAAPGRPIGRTDGPDRAFSGCFAKKPSNFNEINSQSCPRPPLSPARRRRTSSSSERSGLLRASLQLRPPPRLSSFGLPLARRASPPRRSPRSSSAPPAASPAHRASPPRLSRSGLLLARRVSTPRLRPPLRAVPLRHASRRSPVSPARRAFPRLTPHAPESRLPPFSQRLPDGSSPTTSRAPTLPLLCQLSARLRAPLARAPPPPAHAGQALRRPHVAAPRSRRPIVQHGCASRLVRPATLPAALHDYMAGLPLRRLSPLAGQRALRLTATAVVDEVLFPTTNEPAYMTTFC